MGFVLAREKVFLDEVGPVRVRRFADDPVGALSLALLIHVLAGAAARRGQVLTHPKPEDVRLSDNDRGPVRSPLLAQGGHRA